ncbi:methyl-accepting chemotaxis protein [Skermanella mucosa]|uniref:methyl-accepting chemotaxis protein n=1 Tax=Skermanella mucosa TaxID=1789672 RepID=UPI00192B0342|nr:methyl-accepting chemotaxis protein [Skermanella mucosa]UEM20227.1 methyl-accepting chemotaxis protein [Skermanella mucosa]
MPHLTLRQRLTGLAAGLTIAAGVTGSIGAAGIVASNRAADDLTVMSDALASHLLGDMMHDALRADVLTALLSSAYGTQESDHDATREALDEHAGTFRAALRANAERAGLDGEIKAALDEVEPALNRYIAAAETIVGLTLTSPVEAQVRMPDFIEAFETLEERNGAISDLIGRRKAERALHSATTGRFTIALTAAITLLTIAAALVLSVLSVRSITRPLAQAAAAIQAIGAGRRDVALDGTGPDDELGKVARAILTMQTQASALDAMRAAEDARRDAASREALRMAEATGRFNDGVAGVVAALLGADRDLRVVAEGISAQAATASRQAQAVQSAAGSTASAVESIASASEGLASSVKEVGGRTAEAAAVTREAVAHTGQAAARIQDLEGAAQRIGDVVRLINGIAEQTNLLALNATIEAARAGEAGKGFAIVAQEVKVLANQTASATAEISTQIAGIQTETGMAVEAMREVAATVERVNAIATAIAGSVEQQSAATERIASSMVDSAGAAREITGSLGSVTRAIRETDEAVGRMTGSAVQIARQIDTLRAEAARFTAELQSGKA